MSKNYKNQNTYINWQQRGKGQPVLLKLSQSLDCSDVAIRTINNATYNNLCEYNDIVGSTGRISGGSISDAGSAKINVASRNWVY